jgi:hypothetical protein
MSMVPFRLGEVYALCRLPIRLGIVTLANSANFLLVHNRTLLATVLDREFVLGRSIQVLVGVHVFELHRIAPHPISSTLVANYFPVVPGISYVVVVMSEVILMREVYGISPSPPSPKALTS